MLKTQTDHQGMLVRTGIPVSLAWMGLTICAYCQTTNYDFNLQVSSPVYTLVVQPDGKILVGSIYTPQRLQTNGAIDLAFDPRLTNGHNSGLCYTLGVQDDGKILVGGSFTSAQGQ